MPVTTVEVDLGTAGNQRPVWDPLAALLWALLHSPLLEEEEEEEEEEAEEVEEEEEEEEEE